MNKKILLTKRNRYGSMIWLEHVDNNKYQLRSTNPSVLNYCQISYDELPEDSDDYDTINTDQFGKIHKERIITIDPDGGPYLHLGCKVTDTLSISRIIDNEDGIYIMLKADS